MKIRRLEIQGFKSFADRTVLRFGEGITGVVGPNGCGKSNIVDAIRWVMGEQSAKHLRGSGMQDVIFAGSESRGPSGVSEVTLTFKNDGELVPSEYQRCEEISVTRRLFRDGTSEYEINKVQCRLRDILELFMGTGVGKNAYSIIEQGRIGLIVTAKPEDRRTFIEDAAGVSRYKARRKQAERRILATEQNLLRVTDITDELGARLGSLERQAKKAERYKRIKGELRELELHYAAHRTLELNALERFTMHNAQAIRQEAYDLEQALEMDEERFAETGEALGEQDRQLRLKDAQIHEHQQSLALAENNVQFLGREQSKVEERAAEAETERAELEAKIEALRHEKAEAEKVRAELGDDSGGEGQTLESIEASLEALNQEIGQADLALEAEKQSMVEALTRIAEYKNNLTNVGRASEEIEEQIAQTTKSRQEVADRRRSGEKRKNELQALLKDNQQMKLQLEDKRTAQEELRSGLDRELLINETHLLESREALMDKRSRLNSLLEIQKNYEGCTAAVRSIMRRKEHDPSMDGALHGLVADVVSAEPRYEAAVEAVLGDRLQYVIVNSQRDGISSIDFLKKHDHGRSSFIPLDLREDHASWAPRKLTSRPPHAAAESAHATELPEVLPSELPATSTGLPMNEADDIVYEEDEVWPSLREPGICGKMVDLVEAQPGYEHVARVLLGDVLVVEDLENARKLWRENGHRKTLVTLSGEVLDPVGVLTGGSSEGVSAGMLAQKREINELSDAVRMLEAKVTVAEERQGSLKTRVGELERGIQSLSKQGHEEEISIVNLQQELKGLAAENARASEEEAKLAEALSSRQKKRTDLETESSESESALRDLQAQKQQIEARVAEQSQKHATKKEEALALSDEVTQLKVAVAANRERRESSARNVERLAQRIQDVHIRLERLAEILSECEGEVVRIQERIVTSRKQGASLSQVVEDEKAALDAKREALEAAQEALKEEERGIKGRRKTIDGLKEQMAERAIEIREFQLAKEQLVEQLDERYNITIEDVLHDFHLSDMQSDEHRKQTEKLRRSLANIGPINLTAIEEYEEVNERYTFLTTQKADLEEAIASLKAAIKRINKTSKERFVEAFRLVNEKFQEVFPKLFNGGRASLVMIDESDPLESGIEMLAQPPGKKLQNVSLLSGGEKALTAVALIFSIFLIKPTPFCLLDEVDAPLDEANVGRYNDILRELSAISQFILITHNKRTMELPDRLYGVTMESPGISKIVPVDVKETKPVEAPLKAV